MAKKKVMIVDDNTEFLEELEEILLSGGYDVIAVSNGESALVLTKKVMPDVILLDIRMNNVSGFQMADKLTCSSETSRIAIVAMTGVFTRNGDSRLMNVCGIKKCLIKPFTREEVISEIENALKEKKCEYV